LHLCRRAARKAWRNLAIRALLKQHAYAFSKERKQIDTMPHMFTSGKHHYLLQAVAFARNRGRPLYEIPIAELCTWIEMDLAATTHRPLKALRGYWQIVGGQQAAKNIAFLQLSHLISTGTAYACKVAPELIQLLCALLSESIESRARDARNKAIIALIGAGVDPVIIRQLSVDLIERHADHILLRHPKIQWKICKLYPQSHEACAVRHLERWLAIRAEYRGSNGVVFFGIDSWDNAQGAHLSLMTISKIFQVYSELACIRLTAQAIRQLRRSGVAVFLDGSAIKIMPAHGPRRPIIRREPRHVDGLRFTAAHFGRPSKNGHYWANRKWHQTIVYARLRAYAGRRGLKKPSRTSVTPGLVKAFRSLVVWCRRQSINPLEARTVDFREWMSIEKASKNKRPASFREGVYALGRVLFPSRRSARSEPAAVKTRFLRVLRRKPRRSILI
jgi:hypothetical protein